jgi:putative nucleotidyltransferase with HDIG domain
VQVSSYNVIAGMKLKEDVITNQGIRLLVKGTIITEYLISYLTQWNIEYLDIEDEQEQVVKNRCNKQLKAKKLYHSTVNSIESFMEALKGAAELKMDEIRTAAGNVLQFVEDNSSLRALNQLKNKDMYTYQHSLNIGIYSALIGKWMEYDQLTIKQLSYAGLLHDLGKTQIDDEILLKPQKLTEQEYNTIKKHTILGYEIIKKSSRLSTNIAMAALQHHEREDGRGYPLGLQGNRIHNFAKIVAIADVFDAMTSERPYKGRQSPFTVVEHLHEESFESLDPKVTRVFLNRIADFYIGSVVVLSNGDVGEIVMMNNNIPTRPLVKVSNGYLDLSKDFSISIQDLLI